MSSILERSVNPEKLLTLLGVEVLSTALPMTTACPLCHGRRLNLYDDSTTGGTWHHCFDCRSAGTLLDLAAKIWGCGHSAAVQKLAEAGMVFPEGATTAEKLRRYVADVVTYRERLEALAEESKANLPKMLREVMPLLRHFRLFCHTQDSNRWNAGPGRLFGATTAKHVNRTFAPNGAAGIFKGSGWKEVLVFPFESLPGQLSGFLFAGRSGKPEDLVFKGRKDDVREAGLFGLWTVAASNAALGRFVVAFETPAMAARLQLRHYASSGIPLPLVSWYSGIGRQTKESWRALGSRVPVIFCWQLTAEALSQAILADGLLSVADLNAQTEEWRSHYIRNEEPRHFCRTLIRRATPWRDYLRRWAEQGTLGAVEHVLLGLETYGVDRQSLVGLSDKIDSLVGGRAVPRRVTVVEQNGQWWAETVKKLTPLIGAILVVDAVVPSSSRLLHECHLEFADGNKSLPFTIRNPDKVKGDIELAAARVQRIVTVPSGWGTNLLAIAKAFRKPQVKTS